MYYTNTIKISEISVFKALEIMYIYCYNYLIFLKYTIAHLIIVIKSYQQVEQTYIYI